MLIYFPVILDVILVPIGLLGRSPPLLVLLRIIALMFLRLRSILLYLLFLVLLVHQLNVLLLLLILSNGGFFALLSIEKDITDLFSQIKINGIIFDEALDCISAIIDL